MSWKVLEELDARIEKLRTSAEKVTRPHPAESRELVTVLYQEVACVEDDFSLQKQTFYNGDRDTLVIQRLAATVSVEFPPGTEIVPQGEGSPVNVGGIRFSWYKTPIGWGSPLVWWNNYDGGTFITGFDFQWNYVTNSRQSQYSRDMCSSDMLVGLDKGQMLELRVPLVLPKSESVEFQVQPLRFLFPGVKGKVPGTRYFVGFHAFGYRSMP